MKQTCEPTQCSGWLLLIAAIGVLAGCSPMPTADEDFIDHRRDPSADIFRSSELNSVDGAIELVQSSPSPDAEFDGVTGAWIEAMRKESENNVMFPRWEGQRKGAHRFTVRYTHIEIDFDYNMNHVGFEWDVDTMLKDVSGPTVLRESELETSTENLPTIDGIDSFPEPWE